MSEIKQGSRVKIVKTFPAFGNERQAEATLRFLGLAGVRNFQSDFEKILEQYELTVGSVGTVVSVYDDGWVSVHFDSFENKIREFDIPLALLETIEETVVINE